MTRKDELKAILTMNIDRIKNEDFDRLHEGIMNGSIVDLKVVNFGKEALVVTSFNGKEATWSIVELAPGIV